MYGTLNAIGDCCAQFGLVRLACRDIKPRRGQCLADNSYSWPPAVQLVLQFRKNTTIPDLWHGHRATGGHVERSARAQASTRPPQLTSLLQPAYLENRYPLRQKPQVNPADAVPLERIVISSTASPMMMSSPRIGSEKMHHRRTSSSASAIAQRPAEALMAPEQPPQKISMFVLSKRLAWDQIFM